LAEEEWKKETKRLLAFIVRPLFAQVIVTAAQLFPLVRGQILIEVPFFTEVFFVLRREILPALVVALNILFLFGTKTAPLITAIPCPASRGQQQN
jgi:hypothetical protein